MGFCYGSPSRLIFLERGRQSLLKILHQTQMVSALAILEACNKKHHVIDLHVWRLLPYMQMCLAILRRDSIFHVTSR